MNISNALAGLENASASFDSASASLLQSLTPATAGAAQDSLQLSEAMVGLLKSQINFSANIATEIVENSLNRTALSVVG